MDNKLNFDVHVPNKISKCIKIIGIIKRLSVIIPRDVLLKLYKMFIRLHLDYADIVNDKPSNELFSKKMERVHYKACLAIIQAIQGTSQEKLGLESVSDRRWYRMIFFSKKAKINSHQHILILIYMIIMIIQIQLVAPDHHNMNLLEHSHQELKVLNIQFFPYFVK